MIYDETCRTSSLRRGPELPIGLSHTWQAGGPLYRALDRLDAWRGVKSWAEAFAWLAETPEPIREIQYWGHGRRGQVMVAREPLSAESLGPGHPHRADLERVRERLAPGAVWWFRTCDTFGGRSGHAFAQRFADFTGGDVAGFTYVIGVWQSGLHRLSAGCAPSWSDAEGIARGTPERPLRSAWSAPWRPHTITCLDGAIPAGW